MDTSDVEVINPPPLETQDKEVNLETSSNREEHEVVPDDQNQNPVEDSTIVEQFDNLELQSIVEDEEGKPQNYPFRPNATDCAFFIRTGTCKYGLNCRFNHPPKRVFKAVGEKSTEEVNGVVCDNLKKIECKYFSTPGGCKYRDACRYDHPSEEIEMTDPKLNFLGLPMRPMEKECTFYMQTGSCAYGANCRFDHPDPMPANDPEPGNSLTNGYSLKVDNNYPKPSGPMHFSGVSNGVNSRNFTPYASDMNSYHQGMPRNPEWNQNQVSIPHQTADLSKKQDPSANYKHLMQSEEFPERAGQPDCDYFMRTGDCKYKSACRYNHPKSRSSRPPQPTLSSKGLYSRSEKVSPVETTDFHNSYSGNARKNGMSFDNNNNQKMYNGGYPERPGQAECEYYMKTGSCKFNSDCRYHHPRNRVSASSYTLSEKGLPLRPGAKICRNYENQGTCQYGTRCLFNHPDIVSPSDQAVVEDNYNHPSTNLEVPSLESQVSSSNAAESNWNDGWVM